MLKFGERPFRTGRKGCVLTALHETTERQNVLAKHPGITAPSDITHRSAINDLITPIVNGNY